MNPTSQVVDSIATIIQPIDSHIRFRRNYAESKLSNSEIITLAIVREIHGISSYGYCASKKETYYDLKLHATVTLNGYITDIEITAANVDDRAMLWELLSDAYEPIVLGDKGYTEDDCSRSKK